MWIAAIKDPIYAAWYIFDFSASANPDPINKESPAPATSLISLPSAFIWSVLKLQLSLSLDEVKSSPKINSGI